MNRIRSTLLAAACVLAPLPGSTQALAQFQPLPPELQNRIPAPLPPPPGVYQPGRLNTHSDRVTSCLQEGAGYGLKGSKLNAYARSCANAN